MKLEQSDKNFLFSETKLPDVFFTEYMSQAMVIISKYIYTSFFFQNITKKLKLTMFQKH